MRSNLGILGVFTKIIFILLGLAGLLAVGIWYLPLIQQNERLRKEILTLNQEIEKEQITQRRLKSEILDLTSNPITVERRAREILNLSRTNETVVRFEPPRTNFPSPPARRSTPGTRTPASRPSRN